MEIKAIIVDDEQDGRIVLQHHLNNNHSSVKLVGSFSNVDDTINFLKSNSIDLIFLDINMPEKNGFDLLEEIGSSKCHVIFVTAYGEYAIKAIKYSAFDYLLKPIDPDELRETLKRLEKTSSNKEKTETLIHNLTNKDSIKIALSTKDGYTFVKADEIIRCEGDSNYSKIYLKNNTSHLITKTLKNMQEQLPDDIFFRTHKSHLINLLQVESFSKSLGNKVLLKDGSKVEVSRRNRDSFLSKMKNSTID